MTDFQKIICEITAEMSQGASAPRVTVTKEQIAARVREMGQKGYYPSEGSVAAVEAYLRGYGLWLSGNVGTGKTAFFRTIRPLSVCRGRTGQAPKIVIFSMLRTLGMSVEGINEFLEGTRHDEVVLDDVGAEPVFNFYGGKFEILPYIIEKRMDSAYRTHVTTNQSAKELGLRYGARVIDRFKELFFRVNFMGESKRQVKANADIVKAFQTWMAQEAAKTPCDASEFGTIKLSSEQKECARGGGNQA